MKLPYHIAIEGTIGVGKTSLAKILGIHLEAKLILEKLIMKEAGGQRETNPEEDYFFLMSHILGSSMKQIPLQKHKCH